MPAAKEREARVKGALAQLREIETIKKRQGNNPEKARASMTDSAATVMKIGDGGFRPAYNPQLAPGTDSLVIVGVDFATAGADQGHTAPMLKQVSERCGQVPDAWLVDSHQIKASGSETVAAWRERIDTDEAKVLYRKCASTAECSDAQSCNRGLQQFRAQGLDKGQVCEADVCAGTQPDAHDCAGNELDRDRDWNARNSRNRDLRGENEQKLGRMNRQ